VKKASWCRGGERNPTRVRDLLDRLRTDVAVLNPAGSTTDIDVGGEDGDIPWGVADLAITVTAARRTTAVAVDVPPDPESLPLLE
jgi:hypothetical protein